ncbi:MAG: phosphoglucosamine mutase [Planctomycetia bacterium]|nr:phosphoglucosamine mutase [Planctomycetia bacterium]
MADTLIVSVSGLRGVVGTTLTADVAVRYAAAFAAGLPAGPVVIGRDGRTHGPLFAAALRDFFVAAGRDVIDCGIAATPTVGIVVREERAAGGIQISASHNPPRYNGLKLFSAAGRVLPAAAGAKVLERFQTLPERVEPAGAACGCVREVDGGPAHVRLVAATVDVEAIRRRRPKVWLDAGHGAGSRAARILFEHLGCEFAIEGGEPDGLFEHPPEPTAENLAAMLPRIRQRHVDVGFFQDPDADRLAIATADGDSIGEEATLALCVGAVLAKRPGPIVVNCSTSGMAATIAAQHGVACHVSAVGEANVVDEMLAVGAVLGGEGNGGVIEPQVVLVRDSLVAMALVLERLAVGDPGTTVAGLAAALPRLVMKKTKIDLAPSMQGAALAAGLDRIAAAFPNATPSRLDGLRLDFPGGWLLVRASNTEPIVRLVAEAATEAAVDDALTRARTALL